MLDMSKNSSQHFFPTDYKRYFLHICTPFSVMYPFFHLRHRVCLKKSCHVDRDCADSRLNCHPEGFCTGKGTQSYLDIWPHQLCKKLVKETIFNIWRNEKYFSDLLIYQLFGYNFGKI